MAPRDLLALILCCVFAAMWAFYIWSKVRLEQWPNDLDWAILPAGVGAILGAVHAAAPVRAYGGRHRAPKE